MATIQITYLRLSRRFHGYLNSRLGVQLNSSLAFCQREAYSTQTSTTKHKYDLYSAVCLERHPVITRPLNELEERYMKYLQQIEIRKSLKNDFEIRKELEIKQASMIKDGLIEVDLDKPISQTAIDIEEIGNKLLKELVFTPRITDADRKIILTSLDRKLDKNLILLVEQKVGNDMFWIPPQILRIEGETMRDTAERALRENCGEALEVQFYGNAPIGVYKYSYPKMLKDKLNSNGVKIFYFLAKYIKGTVPEKVNHQWLDRNEIKGILPANIHKSLTNFLIPE